MSFQHLWKTVLLNIIFGYSFLFCFMIDDDGSYADNRSKFGHRFPTCLCFAWNAGSVCAVMRTWSATSKVQLRACLFWTRLVQLGTTLSLEVVGKRVWWHVPPLANLRWEKANGFWSIWLQWCKALEYEWPTVPQDLLTNRLVKNVMTWKWWAGFGFNDLRASIVRMFARIVLVFVGFFLGKFGFAQGFHGFLKVFPWCPFYVKRSGSNRAGRGFNDPNHSISKKIHSFQHVHKLKPYSLSSCCQGCYCPQIYGLFVTALEWWLAPYQKDTLCYSKR